MSVSDLVHAVLGLIDDHNGQFPGNKLPRVYERNRKFRNIISEHGGLKKFCTSCRDLEFASSSECPSGWIQKRATAQSVVEALLKIIDQEGGQVGTSQLPSFYAANKDVIETHGNLKKFCGVFPELKFITLPDNRRFIKRSTLLSAPQSVEALFVPQVAEALISFSELSPDLVAASNSVASVVLKVSDIRWSQDCIKTHFTDGNSLVDVVQDLMDSPGLLKRLPSMEVLQVGGKWFAVNGNRRLWVLKEYARRVCPDLTLGVNVFKGSPGNFRYMLKKRFTTANNGVQMDVVLEHRAREYQRFQSMALALDHRADKILPRNDSGSSASTSMGSSSDEGEL